jgi:hypothetical protein
MRVEQLGLEIPFPELFFCKLSRPVSDHNASAAVWHYFVRHILAVRRPHYGIFVENVMDKLRRNANFDFSTFHRLWAGVD